MITGILRVSYNLSETSLLNTSAHVVLEKLNLGSFVMDELSNVLHYCRQRVKNNAVQRYLPWGKQGRGRGDRLGRKCWGLLKVRRRLVRR